MLVLLVICLAGVAMALPAGPPAFGPPPPASAPPPPPPPPAYAPAPYHYPKPIDEAPEPYAFQYGTADDYSGAKFNAQETADGKAVTGSYQVALPDGRIQTVTYTADHYNGYVADVKYEGTPVYPEAKPYHPAPKTGYHAKRSASEYLPPQPFSYQYGVADDYSGANYEKAGYQDASGNLMGSYRVNLPDGRVQIVTYTADHTNGFVADVKYEGTAVYPEEKPYAPAPKYAPAPPKYAPA